MLNLKKNDHSGKLIVFEGTDGAGKTTMLNMTIEYLTEKFGADKLLVTKQPTDYARKTKLFQKMMYSYDNGDISYRAMQLLTLSDRVQHNFEEIEPTLKDGKIVISDRYIYTSVANMIARGYTKEEWFFDASQEIIKPDLAFLAYVDPDLAIRRIKNRPEEARRFLNEPLLRAVAQKFLDLREEADFKVLDTTQKPEIAFERVKNNLEKLFLGEIII